MSKPRLSGRSGSPGNTELSPARAFYSVSEIAQRFGMSDMTLYRAIRAGEFPALRIRGRFIIPAKAIDAMVDAAVDSGCLVDAADWEVTRTPKPNPAPSAGPGRRPTESEATA